MYVSLSHTITSSCIEQVARRNAFAVEFLFSIAALGRPPLPRLEDASHVFDVLQRSYYQLSSSFLFLRLIPLAPSSPLRCALPSHVRRDRARKYNIISLPRSRCLRATEKWCKFQLREERERERERQKKTVYNNMQQKSRIYIHCVYMQLSRLPSR